MRKLLLFLAALLSCSGAQQALASPLLELTGGFGGTGGLQARHTGASAASSYFNPALLPRARTGLTMGTLVLNTNIGVRVGARSAENAVPEGVSYGFHPGNVPLTSKPIATDLLQNGRAASADGATSYLAPRPRQWQGTGDQTLAYGAFGLVVNPFEGRLALGVYGLVPFKDFLTMRSFFVDEREQYMSNSLHPEMYGDRMTALSFAFALGAQLTKSLSLGVGATLSMFAFAGAPVFVASANELTKLDLNVDVKVKVKVTPHLGLSFDPGKRWHLSGTVHAPQKLDIASQFSFLLATAVEQSSTIAFTYFYQPWQASAGLGYDFYVGGGRTWSVSGLAHYQRWSKYIDRQSVRPADAYRWLDTLTGAVGLRMQDERFSLALDGQYKPSPVPAQTGRTNYVDNDRLGACLAAEYGFKLSKVDMKLGLQLQLYRLLERSVKKIKPPTADGQNHTPQLVWDELPDDAIRNKMPLAGREGLQTNNPGWPGYTSLGWVTSAGLYLTVLL